MADDKQSTNKPAKQSLSRRDFLKFGATAGAVGAAAPLLSKRSLVFHPIQQVSGDPLTI